jgi:hypothetical protein
MASRIGAGWLAAVPDLAGDERRFWISAYITETALGGVVRHGDRVLIRGVERDFAYEASRILAVRRLLEQGVEVRRLQRLHAKVFVRELRPRPIAWIGSANMTTRGRSDGGNSNLEAMAGPVLLEPEEMSRLEGWWSDASPITDVVLAEIEHQAKVTADQDAIDRLVRQGVGVVALRLTYRSSETAFRIPATWFETAADAKVDSVWKDVVTTVPFRTDLDGTDTFRDRWSLVRETLGRGLRQEIAEPVEGAGGLYVLSIDDRAQLDRELSDLNTRLASIFRASGSQPDDAGCAAFVRKAREIIETLSSRRPRSAPWGMVESELRRAYARFTETGGFRVGYVFFLPLNAEDEQFEKAVDRFKQRPIPLFGIDRRQRVERLMATVLRVAAGQREW